MRVVADDVMLTAGANGAILVNEGRNRVEFLVVAGHDPTAFPREMPAEYLSMHTLWIDPANTRHTLLAGDGGLHET